MNITSVMDGSTRWRRERYFTTLDIGLFNPLPLDRVRRIARRLRGHRNNTPLRRRDKGAESICLVLLFTNPTHIRCREVGPLAFKCPFSAIPTRKNQPCA